MERLEEERLLKRQAKELRKKIKEKKEMIWNYRDYLDWLEAEYDAEECFDLLNRDDGWEARSLSRYESLRDNESSFRIMISDLEDLKEQLEDITKQLEDITEQNNTIRNN